MRDQQEFLATLNSIDRKGCAEYNSLAGDFDFSRYILKLSRIQEKPDETNTLVVVRVPQNMAAFPSHLSNSPVRRTALEDCLTRRLALEIEKIAHFDSEGVA
ncbi:MAG: ABC-ATPase domain-containing protein, partial [Lentisphaerota bacterium]